MANMKEMVREFLQVSVPTLTDVLYFDYKLSNAMSSSIKSLLPKKRIAGSAVTALWTVGGYPTGSLDPLFEAIDSIGDGQIFVISNGANPAASCMGDLVAAALHARGAEGAVMDGPVRDIEPIIDMNFPIFSAGVCPVNIAGKATMSANHPIMCGGVQVRPADILVADWDGVVVVPHELAEEVLHKAAVIDKNETVLREKIRSQIKSKKLADIFAEGKVHGVSKEENGKGH